MWTGLLRKPFNHFRSPPALNALSPAPVSTSELAFKSPDFRPGIRRFITVSWKTVPISTVSALKVDGEFSVSVATLVFSSSEKRTKPLLSLLVGVMLLLDRKRIGIPELVLLVAVEASNARERAGGRSPFLMEEISISILVHNLPELKVVEASNACKRAGGRRPLLREEEISYLLPLLLLLLLLRSGRQVLILQSLLLYYR
mmetsp:Transcript_14596/g.31646  ORF Transcript_14596/g.31646 Transcript_14596/m.31646 type:complete len:201 (-) Transcript_14596:21-623(-)